MSLQWYALCSKPNKEGPLWWEVHAQGFEVFYPEIRVQPVNPRSRKVRPDFPGYMVDAINQAGGEILDGLKHGETIKINSGPFMGYEALFDAYMPGGERVRVLLKLLEKRLVPLELPTGQIQQKTRYSC
jgi:transcriptional antiterminator RfaH